MSALPGRQLAASLIVACLAAPALAIEPMEGNPDPWPSFSFGVYYAKQGFDVHQYDQRFSSVEGMLRLPLGHDASIWAKASYDGLDLRREGFSEFRIGLGFTVYLKGPARDRFYSERRVNWRETRRG